MSLEEIDAIKRRAREQKYPERRTDIYQWYVRFFSLGIGIVAAVIFLVDPEPRWSFMSVLWLTVTFQQHLNWKRFQELYILKMELEKTEMSNQASEAIGAGAPQPQR